MDPTRLYRFLRERLTGPRRDWTIAALALVLALLPARFLEAWTNDLSRIVSVPVVPIMHGGMALRDWIRPPREAFDPRAPEVIELEMSAERYRTLFEQSRLKTESLEREVGELKYGQELVAALPDDPLVGEHAHRLVHYTTVTREPWHNQKRITTCMEDGQLYSDLGVPPLDPAVDRVMVCGSMDMINDIKALTENAGFKEGSNAHPAEFVIEKAFVG